MTNLHHYDQESIKNFEKRFRGNFINSLSGFKSANLVGTKSDLGQTNLAIMSSATHVGADPALISLLFRPDVSERHTLNNIRETKYCTLNHINSDIIKMAHQTSARYPHQISEFNATGLNEQYNNNFYAPFVQEANIKIALKLEEEILLKINGTHMVIMSIQDVYLNSEIVSKDGNINIEKAKTICISGLDSYHNTSIVGRLSYAKTDKDAQWI